MKINKSELDTIAVMPSQYPDDELPEIAFAGRSNVGKSSFINSMLNRKNLARTSSKPGKTRTLNFYKINDEFRFVDLPGYGYAQVSKKEKDKWARIINEYLETRENLREVILVVDIRHKPTKDDLMMYNWIVECGFSGLVIATKADKISRGKWDKHTKIIRDKLKIKDPNLVLPYSADKLYNKEDAWSLIKLVARI